MEISKAEELILIGEVGKPCGVKGEVRIFPLTDNPKRLSSLKQVYLIKSPAKPKLYEIEGVCHSRRFASVKFSGCDTKDAARALSEARVGIPRAECPQLPEGSYYYFDIIGLETFTQQGRYLGKIEAIIPTASSDVYVIRDGSGGEILVPAISEVIAEVAPREGRVVIRTVEGLITSGSHDILSSQPSGS